MRFNAPEVIDEIRDIYEIYKINDKTGDQIDHELERLEDEIFIKSCSKEKLQRYEDLLGINPKDTDDMETRRFAVITGLNDSTPFTITGITSKVETLCGSGKFSIDFDVSKGLLHFSLSLEAKNRYQSVMEMLDEVLPLNIVITGEILYHIYSQLNSYTYSDLKEYDCEKIREV